MKKLKLMVLTTVLMGLCAMAFAVLPQIHTRSVYAHDRIIQDDGCGFDSSNQTSSDDFQVTFTNDESLTKYACFGDPISTTPSDAGITQNITATFGGKYGGEITYIDSSGNVQTNYIQPYQATPYNNPGLSPIKITSITVCGGNFIC